jgi:hypothetical protein
MQFAAKVCRQFTAMRQTRGKFFSPVWQIYRAVTATFAASLLRLLPRLLPQDYRKVLFIFCRDVFRGVTTPFAATIAAIVAGHFSANTIELFAASIYALFDAVIAANDSYSFFIPIAVHFPRLFPHMLPCVCRVFVATIAAWLPRLFRVVTATKLINRHLS